jgi:hypothetical protein
MSARPDLHFTWFDLPAGSWLRVGEILPTQEFTIKADDPDYDWYVKLHEQLEREAYKRVQ